MTLMVDSHQPFINILSKIMHLTAVGYSLNHILSQLNPSFRHRLACLVITRSSNITP